MFRRALASWRGVRQSLMNAEGSLTRLTELAEAAAERQIAAQNRLDMQIHFLRQMELHVARLEYQAALSNPRYASPLRLERFGRKHFSQNDEDGILAEIFRRIGAEAQTFVEIAAGDGNENCTAAMLNQGWSGLWVECDDANVKSIRSRWSNEIASGQLQVASTYVRRETINDIIASAGFKGEIDLLVMDIDSNDYHLLNVMEAKPRVLCVEYFGREAPPSRWVMPYEEEPMGDWSRPTGASLQAYEELLAEKGYLLVGTTIAGMNSFFVRSDLVQDKFQAPFTAYNHYNPPRYWYQNFGMITAWNGPADGKPPKKE
ncbi:MAG: hypothetical protein Q8R82_15230 [Hyphomonadaceae bacterium]|nr:hypothetical protein [Hyphomonadaceae bacterium]